MFRAPLVLACLAMILGATTVSADDPASIGIAATRTEAVVVVAGAGQAAVQIRTLASGQSGFPVRKEVDPKDATERFLLLAPGGPLLIELELTIDGRPFRIRREKLVDDLMARADADGDGTAFWREAIKNPRFGFGRVVRAAGTTESTINRLIKQFDTNSDTLVDRFEVRAFIAQTFRSAAFTLTSGVTGQGSESSPVRKLLDTDEDGILREQELAAATERLTSRDADANELVTSAELSGQPVRGTYTIITSRGGIAGGEGSLLQLLGPAADWSQVYKALQAKYGDDQEQLPPESFSARPELVAALDSNENGRLNRSEVDGFDDLPADIKFEADFSTTTPPKVELKLVEFSANLGDGKQPAATGNTSTTLRLSGLVLKVAATPTNRASSLDRQSKAYFDRFDKDNNGYLEKDEFTGNLQAVARQFETWDADADGKVYLKELTAFFERQAAPALSQISASLEQQEDPLLLALDLSGDGRLSMREMKYAGRQLGSLDKNEDGSLSGDEVPAQLTLHLSHGGNQYGYGRNLVVARSQGGFSTARPTPAAGPEWFRRMDRNGDGDITPREFLGKREQFEKLDTNGDGFIEPKEAAGKD